MCEGSAAKRLIPLICVLPFHGIQGGLFPALRLRFDSLVLMVELLIFRSQSSL
jgi:hypothetical protein